MNVRLAGSPLHQPAPHEAGPRHVTGEARYVDDLPAPPGMLHGFVVGSPHARARILDCDAAGALAFEGVHAVLFARDLPGERRLGPIVHDEAFLAENEVEYVGHPVAVVVAESREIGRRAAAALAFRYDPLPPILSIEAAESANEWLGTPHVIARGDVEAGLASAALVVRGEVRTPAQDHFYLETQCSLAVPEEGGYLRVISSTQHPSEIQKLVAAALRLDANQVACEVLRMGGGFGGKESQASQWAVFAALGARVTGRPVKVWLDRGQDMATTGKRHPFRGRYEAGFAADGTLLALRASLVADGGFSTDLSIPILDRAMFHLDNAYFVPALRFEGRVARTNLPSNTAFRGFGGPQGMLVVEDAIERGAAMLGLDPAEVRRKSYYRPGRDVAPYGQAIADPRIERIHASLSAESRYAERRAEIEAYNRTSRWTKRGIALQPVKFGISFTNSPLNQAGALVLMYTDGTVQVNHGGTEMGQGLNTKITAVASDVLGVTPPRIRVPPTSTEKVPNTSATAASSGSDLNGAAVREACLVIRERLAGVAAQKLGCRAEDVRFAADHAIGPDGAPIGLADVAKAAWLERVPLSATGYYRTPGIGYDREAGRGTPFYYFAWGAAVVEVAICGLTGEHRLLRVDILHDVGDSLVPSIDIGQVEGGFVQGYGWLTMEQVQVRPDGSAITRGPSTYKIPAIGDVPEELHVRLLPGATQPGVIGGSKAVGEPPLMLAIGVVGAVRHAISGFGGQGFVDVALPVHPENVLRAVEARRGR